MTDKMNNFLVTGVDGFPIEMQPMLTVAGFSVGSLAEYVKVREQIYRDRITFLQERIQELREQKEAATPVGWGQPVPSHPPITGSQAPNKPMGPTIPAGAPYGPMDNGVPVRSSQEPAHDRAFSLDNVRELLHAEIKSQWGGRQDGPPLPSGEFRRNVAITLLDILSPL